MLFRIQKRPLVSTHLLHPITVFNTVYVTSESIHQGTGVPKYNNLREQPKIFVFFRLDTDHIRSFLTFHPNGKDYTISAVLMAQFNRKKTSSIVTVTRSVAALKKVKRYVVTSAQTIIVTEAGWTAWIDSTTVSFAIPIRVYMLRDADVNNEGYRWEFWKMIFVYKRTHPHPFKLHK